MLHLQLKRLRVYIYITCIHIHYTFVMPYYISCVSDMDVKVCMRKESCTWCWFWLLIKNLLRSDDLSIEGCIMGCSLGCTVGFAVRCIVGWIAGCIVGCILNVLPIFIWIVVKYTLTLTSEKYTIILQYRYCRTLLWPYPHLTLTMDISRILQQISLGTPKLHLGFYSILT